MPVKRAKPAPKEPTRPRAKAAAAKPTRTRAKAASKPASAERAAKAAKPTRAKPRIAEAPGKPAEKAPGKQNHHRRLFALDVYEANKNEIKAPFKALGMKWQYLGPGKGRYAKEGVQAFVQFKDEGADFSVWGPDAEAVAIILAAWKPLGSDAAEAAAAATEAEAEAAESEAMRLWRLAKPVPRPGEPEGFYRRRLAEWDARRPA
ncbi:MAG TPA: hypothetical protein VM889_00435 [Candidatus Thermoplasmatota archaeon]|nr:hypothetical protein [Candidatus Thermoplasmatota archaeon]